MQPRQMIENLDAFYADERRKRSGESDFGVMWTARPNESWPTYRVSFIRETHEFYSYSHRDGSFEILGRLPENLAGEDPYDVANKILEGWTENCRRGGLGWAREKIRIACAAAWRDHEAGLT